MPQHQAQAVQMQQIQMQQITVNLARLKQQFTQLSLEEDEKKNQLGSASGRQSNSNVSSELQFLFFCFVFFFDTNFHKGY